MRGWIHARRRFSFEGKVALVTGGSRGLGLVIARKLVAAGSRVIILARDPAEIRRALSDLRSLGGQAYGIICDVQEQQQVEAAIREALALHGSIDLLFNVAGMIQVGPLENMRIEDFHAAMATNCWGVLHTTLAVRPHMRARGWGRIVNVASLGGKRAVPHMLPYTTSKFALVGLSTALRTELAKEGILVTTVSPGLMRTGIPRNALFKGQHQKEYLWFSISDSLPLISMSAERAADEILHACRNGQAELILSGLGKAAAVAQSLFPNLSSEILSLVNQYLLPEPGGIGAHSARGYESKSAYSPSWITTLTERAAVRNNEQSMDGSG
jgi:NAD(P)-dependent dehydrogenase (short-subunit alcohol dehydrogenase family)